MCALVCNSPSVAIPPPPMTKSYVRLKERPSPPRWEEPTAPIEAIGCNLQSPILEGILEASPQTAFVEMTM